MTIPSAAADAFNIRHQTGYYMDSAAKSKVNGGSVNIGASLWMSQQDMTIFGNSLDTSHRAFPRLASKMAS